MERNNVTDLEKFVSSALVQITRAVKNSSEEVKLSGGVVAPRVRGGASTAAQAGHLRSPRRVPVTLVDFDIAVTISESNDKEAKIGVLSGVFNAGTETKADTAIEHISRMKFSVPIEFPSTEPYPFDPSKANAIDSDDL